MASRFEIVYDRAGRPVEAKTLVDLNGLDIINPLTGAPLIVPRDYDLSRAIQLGESIRPAAPAVIDPSNFSDQFPSLSFYNTGLQVAELVKVGSPEDLQRSYNGHTYGADGTRFVPEFTAAASFHFGVLGTAAGFGSETLVAGGGLYNVYKKLNELNFNIDSSGDWSNNPENPPLIRLGYNKYKAGLLGGTPSNSHDVIFSAPRCFVAGTPILMADGTTKPIEQINPGDEVAAFDPDDKNGQGPLKPGRVRRTFTNTPRVVINLRGLHMTPGHVVLLADGRWAKIAEALRDDHAIVEQRGDKAVPVRARTGAVVGSVEDIPIKVLFRDKGTGAQRVATVRAGIPVLAESLGEGKSRLVSMADILLMQNYRIEPDGAILCPQERRYNATPWASEEEMPDELDMRESWLIALDGKPFVPHWIRDLPIVDEVMGQMAVNNLPMAPTVVGPTMHLPNKASHLHLAPTGGAPGALNRKERRKRAAQLRSIN